MLNLSTCLVVARSNDRAALVARPDRPAEWAIYDRVSGSTFEPGCVWIAPPVWAVRIAERENCCKLD